MEDRLVFPLGNPGQNVDGVMTPLPPTGSESQGKD